MVHAATNIQKHGKRVRPSGWLLQQARLLLAAILFVTFSAATHAQTSGTTGGLIWSTTNSQVTITGYSGTGGAVNIPATINSLPVTSIGVAAFLNCSSLTSMTIPSSVTSIGSGSFFVCNQLTAITVSAQNPVYSSVDGVLYNKNQSTLIHYPGGITGSFTIPTSVTSIEGDAFYFCTRLTSVTIPSSVTSIGTFDYCTRLTAITVDPANPSYSSVDGVLYDKNQSTLIQCPGGITGSYTIPNSVTSIGDNAFNCSGLTSVTIPSSVTSIGAYAFQSCSSLTSVTIPNSVTSIGNYAFQSCSSLTAITVDPSNFSYCSDTNGVLFNKTQSTLIQCPGGITGSSYTIPSSVTSIGDYAFAGCTSLTSVTIPNSVTSIGYVAFEDTRMMSVTIPNSVTSIENNAFDNCTSLTSAIFMGNAPLMGSNMFDSAASGFTVDYLSGASGFSTPTWNGYPSQACNLPTITTNPVNLAVASGTTVTFAAAATGTPPPTVQWQVSTTGTGGSFTNIDNVANPSATTGTLTLTNVTSDQNGYAYQAVFTNIVGSTTTTAATLTIAPFTCTTSNNQITITGYTGPGGAVTIPDTINSMPVTSIGTCAFYTCTNVTSITIPNSVTTIGSGAFEQPLNQISNLTSITIPNSVTTIGSNAFNGCNGLTSITIPNSVTTIGSDAFNGCYGLTSVAIPDSVTKIESETFWGCWSLASITIPDSITSIGANAFGRCWSLTKLTIPNGLTSIGDSAFSGCGITTIVIPDNIKTIGDWAFSGCPLTGITIGNNVSSIGSNAFNGCGLTSVTIPSSVTSIWYGAFWGCSSLNTSVFAGDAPTMGSSVFVGTASGFTVDYFNGATGFTSPTWNGYPSHAFASTSPTITSNPTNQAVTSGTTATFTAAATGTPAPTVQWQVSTTGTAGPFTNIDNVANPSAATGTLTLNNVTSDQNGYAYQAVFTNIAGSTTTTAATLTVFSFPLGSSLPSGSLNSSYNQPLQVTGGVGPYIWSVSGSLPPGMSLSSSGVWSGTPNAEGTYNFTIQVTDSTGATVSQNMNFSILPFTYTTTNGQIAITGYSGTSGAVNISGTINGLPVTSIGDNAFAYCQTLTIVTIPNSVTTIGVCAFGYCPRLTSVTIPNSVTSIGDEAFGSCSGLTSVTIPNRVTAIGCAAFEYCWSLTSVTILNGVTTIGSNAFANCTGLISVSIPSSVTSIGEGAFFNCYALTTLPIIPTSVTSIGNGMFENCTGLTSITIPNSITSIGDNAFYGCCGSTSVTIPNSITSIGDYAFCECSSLNNVIIPNSVIRIGNGTFDYCPSLTSVTIPNSVTSIGNYAFYRCQGLTSVTIPNSVTNIGSQAFAGCTYLKSAVFMGSAPSMGTSVFNSTASGFAVQYYNGATGFTSPWNGYTTVNNGTPPVSSWLIFKGLSSNADLQSTPNGDGIPLLMKYALNLDPCRNESSKIPQPVVTGNQMSLTYYAGSPDVTYTVQSSTDLQTWSTDAVTLSGPDANSCYTATVPTTGPKRFLRLVVVH